ncbi:MAG: membrane integrity-associated transporter subunit PqiC [Desulfobulbaceae bacterium]|nr:membrane integrity-associated transporter subunit PqiC [Desulfobulbaceae bacterium]
MIRYVARLLTGCLLLSTFLMLSGCVGRSSPKVNYFSLLSIEQLGEPQVIATHPEVKLGVGPVTIPESLKRSQIVTRQHGNLYDFSEFNRWAGVLEKDLAAVVGDNLGVLLGVEKVDYFPWMSHFKPNYRIVIDIQRLDGALDGEAELAARWTVADSEGKELLAGNRNVFRQPLQGSGFAALVKAESLLVAELSKTLAEEIDRLITR